MTAVWHENPTCLDHIICGRGTPQEQSLTSDPLSPINSWLAFVRDEHFSSQTFDAASNNVESEGTIDTAIATGLKLQDACASFEIEQLDTAEIKELFQNRQAFVLFLCQHNVVLQFLPHHIRESNNGISTSTDVTDVKAFQMQQLRETVMANKPSTAWFPTASAVAVHDKWLRTTAFAETLSTLSGFVPTDCRAKTKKGGESHVESFEITDPRCFVEWLLPTLTAASSTILKADSDSEEDDCSTGGTRQTNCVVQKTVHDTVACASQQLPWRRSAAYCGLNALLHVHFVSTLGPLLGRVCYKINRLMYMVYVWRHLVEKLVAPDSTDAHVGKATAFLVKMKRRFVKLQHDVADAMRVGSVADPATHTSAVVITERDIEHDIEHIRESLTQAHAAIDAQWQRRTSAPITIASPGCADDLLNASLSTFVGHSALANKISDHNRALETALAGIANAAASGCTAMSTATLSTASDQYEFILRAEEHFDWLLADAAANTAVVDEFANVGELVSELKGLKRHLTAATDPIAYSMCVLVSLTLFLRIDRAVGCEHPLIKEFSTGVDPTIVNAIVLPSVRWRKVANRLQTALKRRVDGTGLKQLYDDNFTFHTMAAQDALYATQVDEFINDTTAWEDAKIAEKLEEVRLARREKATLPDRIAALHGRHHDNCNERGYYMRCDLCRLTKEQDFLPVAPFCRVLPNSTSTRNIIAFEVTQPIEILQWREAGAFVAATVFGRDYVSRGAEAHEWISYLVRSIPLPDTGPQSVHTQVKLVSSVKWMENSHFTRHRNKNGIDCSNPDDQFVKVNGGTVQLANPVNENPDATRRYKFTLSEGSPYEVLQKCIDLPSTSACNQNFALANQDQCPESLSLNEFVAFGSIRSGCVVQHLNLLRALAGDMLSFSHPDVLLMVLQTLWEAGDEAPTGQWWRLADSASFREPAFVNALLDAAERLLVAAHDQWERPWTVAVVAVVAARSLFPRSGSAQHAKINARAVTMLRDCRATAARWLCAQTSRLREDITTGKMPLDEISQRTELLFYIAVTGLMSFVPVMERDQLCDGIERTIGHALLSDNDSEIGELKDTTVLEQVLMLAAGFHAHHDNASLAHAAPLLTLVKHILTALHPYTQQCLQGENTSTLTAFASRSSQLIDRHAAITWTQQSSTDNLWYHTYVLDVRNGSSTHTIEVNILSGEVLVNGDSADAVPSQIRSTKAFQLLFGDRPLVVQSAGHHVWHTLPTLGAPGFELQWNGQEVVIEMKLENGQKWRLLSKMKEFGPLLPKRMLALYSHWICNGRVCFLPQTFSAHTLKYFANPEQLSLYICHHLDDTAGTFVVRDNQASGCQTSLLGVHDHAITKFCRDTLERADLGAFTHVWWKDYGGLPGVCTDTVSDRVVRNGRVCVEATRMQLEFELTKHSTSDELSLEAVFNPGFAVAANQNFGSLVGLSVGLLLESTSGSGDHQLILPVWLEGHTRSDDGVRGHCVTLVADQKADTSVGTFRYKLNAALRQLIGPADTTAFLYLAYLHAITSSFQLQPDPWTGCTGAQAAMNILQSPRVQRHEPYTSESKTLLTRRLADLTPDRVWYPAHLRVMETIRWRPECIPPELALEGYAELARALVHENNELASLFDPEKQCGAVRQKNAEKSRDKTKMGSPDLYKRAAVLHARYLPTVCISPVAQTILQDSLPDIDGNACNVVEPMEEQPACISDGPWFHVAAAFGPLAHGNAPNFDAVGELPSNEEELIRLMWSNTTTPTDGIMVRNKEAYFCAGWLNNTGCELFASDASFEIADCSKHFLTLVHLIGRAESPEENLFLLSGLAWHISPESLWSGMPLVFNMLCAMVHYNVPRLNRPTNVGESSLLSFYNNESFADHLSTMSDQISQRELEFVPDPPRSGFFGRLTSKKKVEWEEAVELQRAAFDNKVEQQRATMHTEIEKALRRVFACEDHADAWLGDRDMSHILSDSVLDARHFEKTGLKQILQGMLRKVQCDYQVRRFVCALRDAVEEAGSKMDSNCEDDIVPQTGVTKLTKFGGIPQRVYQHALRRVYQQTDVPWMETPELPPAPWHNFICDGSADVDGEHRLLHQVLLDSSGGEDGDMLTEALNSRTKTSFTQLGNVRQPVDAKTVEALVHNARTFYDAVAHATTSMWELQCQSFALSVAALSVDHVSPSALVYALISTLHPNRPDNHPSFVFTPNGHSALVELMQLWVLQQKAVRILHYHHVDNTVWLRNECTNPPHGLWAPREHLLWLCFELESNVSIWDRQYEVCQKMRADGPEAAVQNKHSLVQLNMGEGKTSVILPMLAACLGNGDNLCRVVVPNALLRGNADSLALALGGLLGRKVYSVPFRRDVTLTQALMDGLHERYRGCRECGDIVITTPESVLSFQLKFTELASTVGVPETAAVVPSGNPEMMTQVENGEAAEKTLRLAQSAAAVQRFVLEFGREVLDEADSVLHYKRQLVYTMGCRQLADGKHLRWEVAQKVMLAVFENAQRAQDEFGAEVIELHPFGGVCSHNDTQTSVHTKISAQVPRLLEASGDADAAWEWIRQETFDQLVRNSHALELPVLLADKMQIAKRFVLEPGLTDAGVADVYVSLGLDDTATATLEILRGLLSYDVLRLALTKRWRVDFGVDRVSHKRKIGKHGSAEMKRKIAVPFEAKDSAKANTEFGHVDVAVVLTIISYSRSGLTDDELAAVFEHLQGKSEPERQYQSIIDDGVTSAIDKRYASLKSISRTDPTQWGALCNHLRQRYGVIKYYLNTIVFPHEVKQYQQKLVATPWDLVMRCKARPMSGFSGTNDTEWLLPPTVEQQDLPVLGDTNARVLDAVMRKENNVVVKLSVSSSTSREEILKNLHGAQDGEKQVNVLLDVGALLLEDNTAFAKEWLERRPECSGVVLYESDRLVVLDRNKRTVPFTVSPLAGNLGACLVLLDEAHCRGTDLQLPKDSVAALTLGRGLTRDKFVQAALRMRALISGQHSLIFLAAAEVHLSLVALAARQAAVPRTGGEGGVVTNHTVVRWTLENTRHALYDGVGHWVSQSVFSSANDAEMLRLFGSSLDDSSTRPYDGASLARFGTQLRCRDAVDLKMSYGTPRFLMDMLEVCEAAFPPNANESNAHPWVADVRAKCFKLFRAAPKRHRNVLVDEEQERELERQQEEERHVQRPPRANPCPASVDPHLIKSVRSGCVAPELAELNHLFATRMSDPHTQRVAGMWHGGLRYSQDFWRVVQGNNAEIDEHLRPVVFVVQFAPDSAGRGAACVLVSPHEADALVRQFTQGLGGVRGGARGLGAVRCGGTSVVLRVLSPRTHPDDLELWDAMAIALVAPTSNSIAAAARQGPSTSDARRAQQSTQRNRLMLAQLHLFAGSTQFAQDSDDRASTSDGGCMTSLEQQMLLAATLGICCSPYTTAEASTWTQDGITPDGFVTPAHRLFTKAWLLDTEETPSVQEPVAPLLRSFLIHNRHIGRWLLSTPLGHVLRNPPTHFFAQNDTTTTTPSTNDGADDADDGDVDINRAKRCAVSRYLTVNGDIDA